MRTQCVLKVAHTPRCPQQQDKRKSGGRKEEDNGVCHLRAFGLNENLSARIKLYCIQNYSNYSTNNYGRRSRSSASDFVFFFWCFFPGRVQVGQALYYAFFTTLWVKRSPVSATRFILCLLFCFFFFLCFLCPSAVALFPQRPIPFFHSSCILLVFFPVCGQCTGGVKVEFQPKKQTRGATKREILDRGNSALKELSRLNACTLAIKLNLHYNSGRIVYGFPSTDLLFGFA